MTDSSQCSTFTGMIPVFGGLLILFEWYWYKWYAKVVNELLILAQGNPLEVHRKREA
jgi:hypothetical protein